MRVISPYTATITLNGKRLDSPIKWHRVSLGKEKEKRKKKKTQIYAAEQRLSSGQEAYVCSK